jgi:hypothetical protein
MFGLMLEMHEVLAIFILSLKKTIMKTIMVLKMCKHLL